MATLTLSDQFELASAHFRPIYDQFPDRVKLRMYALYNQATKGDVTEAAPSKMNIRKYAMWDARKRCAGMSKELAMKRYISELRTLDPSFSIASPTQNPMAGGDDDGKKTAKKASKNKAKAKVVEKPLEGEYLEKEFKKAADFARNTRRFEGFKQQRILLYSYYKQATEGVCNRPMPSVFSGRVKFARWQAWGNLFDMSKEEAMRKYIELVRKTVPDFDAKSYKELTSAPESADNFGDEIGAEIEETVDDNQLLDMMSKFSVETIQKKLAMCAKAQGFVYFVTGGSGFLGKHLIDELMKRDTSSILVLFVRDNPGAVSKMASQIIKRNGRETGAVDRCFIFPSILSQKDFNLPEKFVNLFQNDNPCPSKFYHLAARYDFLASEEQNEIDNVTTTQCSLELCVKFKSIYEYCSSIVVAGDFNGIFLESSFNEGQILANSYAQTKFKAEKLVRDFILARKNSKQEFACRIYRPGVVVGHSETGEADKIDGPYYFFYALQNIRKFLPEFFILPAIDAEPLPIVPVDYVVKAYAHISHTKFDPNKFCFQLVDPSPAGFIDTLNLFAKAAHSATFSSRVSTILFGMLPRKLVAQIEDIQILKSAPSFFAKNILGIPQELVEYMDNRTSYDDSDTQELLQNSNIKCPPLRNYAWKLWDYFERHLDLKSINKPAALKNEVFGKNVVVTGASDGIGFDLAGKLAKAGSNVIIVARNKERVDAAVDEIRKATRSDKVFGYVADLSQEAPTNLVIEQILKTFNHVDVLINNAGRSIRRSVEYQYKGTGRFHDFERTIALNYYGSLRLILGFLPKMRENKFGQIINISTIGVVTNAPRFGAYVASKAALDAFCRSISGEIASENVTISTVYLPLVKTKMIQSKGNDYNDGITNVYSVNEASEMILESIIRKNRSIATVTGRIVSAAYFFAPSVVESVLNVMYKLEPEKAPEGQEDSEKAQGDKEQLRAVTALLKGAI